VLRGHHDDVTDVAWSHDDAVVMSGSVENEVYMFDVEARRSLVSGQVLCVSLGGGCACLLMLMVEQQQQWCLPA
jgi:hypothetical protein